MTREQLALKAQQLRIAIQGLRMDATDGLVVNPEDVDAVEELARELEGALRVEMALEDWAARS
jgi:hypothetical protein